MKIVEAEKIVFHDKMFKNHNGTVSPDAMCTFKNCRVGLGKRYIIVWGGTSEIRTREALIELILKEKSSEKILNKEREKRRKRREKRHKKDKENEYRHLDIKEEGTEVWDEVKVEFE